MKRPALCTLQPAHPVVHTDESRREGSASNDLSRLLVPELRTGSTAPRTAHGIVAAIGKHAQRATAATRWVRIVRAVRALLAFRHAAICALLWIPATAEGQTARDSTHARAVAVVSDSLKTELCRGGTYSASGLQCNGAQQAPRVTFLRRFRLRLDSLERALIASGVTPPPPVPVNQKPVASFAVSWSGDLATLTSTATDDKGIASCTWRAPGTGRPEKTGCTITRDWGGTAWTEWLIVADSAGLVDSTSRQILLPIAPPPPPDPVALPTPVSTAPGDVISPGPVLPSLTPVFSWSGVSGATGYIVAIRDVAANAIIYPSSTGVGPPISGTSLTLPAGVLAASAAYVWDVTAVNSTSKSLASSNRYFITAAAPTGIGAAELPRVVPAHRDPYPGRPCSVTVPPGLTLASNIAGAISSVRGGAVVCLPEAVTFGASNLPARAVGDTGYIVLRTDTPLPPEGVRIRPSTATRFAKIIVTVGGASALTTTPGTYGYFVRGIEITHGPGVTLTNRLVALGDVGAIQDVMSEVPQRLILSQVWIHGTATSEIQTCVYLNSGSTVLVDSWLSDCHGKGYDSQAIGSTNGPGPHLIRNNYLEGVGENVMYGGATPSIPGLVAADITFSRNHVYTPIAWKGVWTKKNLFELKNAVRVLIEDNVFDGSWTDGQIGPALVFKSINDLGNCNWCRTTDVTVRRSLVRNAAGGIVFSGAENYNPIGTVDSVAKRFLIQDVVFEGLNVAPYTGGGRAIQITGGASDIVFERTVIAGNIANGMVLDNIRTSPRTAFRNSVWSHGGYFATCDGCVIGLPAMTASLPAFQWSAMTVVRGATLDPLPAGTTIVTSEGAAPLAAQIRTTVQQATAGVVIQP